MSEELERKCREAAEGIHFQRCCLCREAGRVLPDTVCAKGIEHDAQVLARHFSDWEPNARLMGLAEEAQIFLGAIGGAYSDYPKLGSESQRLSEQLRSALADVPERKAWEDEQEEDDREEDAAKERERLLLDVLEAARYSVENCQNDADRCVWCRADLASDEPHNDGCGIGQQEAAIAAYDVAQGGKP